MGDFDTGCRCDECLDDGQEDHEQDARYDEQEEARLSDEEVEAYFYDESEIEAAELREAFDDEGDLAADAAEYAAEARFFIGGY